MSDRIEQLRAFTLETQYENAGRAADAAALMPKTSICQHLRQVDAYIRSQGGQVEAITRPWSRSCRHWVIYRGVVRDTMALWQRFKLGVPV